MSRRRHHPITESIKTIKVGDSIAVKRCSGARLIEMKVTKMTSQTIHAAYPKKERGNNLAFSAISGYGVGHRYQIVACGIEDIRKYVSGRDKRSSAIDANFAKLDLTNPDDPSKQHLRIIPELRDKGETLMRRIYMHFCAAQFEVCQQLLRDASADYDRSTETLRQAVFKRGVNQPLTLIIHDEKVVSSLELSGIHDIHFLCNVDRDYLISNVQQFGEKRCEHIARLLTHYGFEHKLDRVEREDPDDVLDYPATIPMNEAATEAA